jgi:hypothetical protein
VADLTIDDDTLTSLAGALDALMDSLHRIHPIQHFQLEDFGDSGVETAFTGSSSVRAQRLATLVEAIGILSRSTATVASRMAELDKQLATTGGAVARSGLRAPQ